ncbi:helix-turn-helix transcriptional regulator [Brevundimonas sp. Root1279]|uniref:helix-turn-helix transcriptional regulator n=1 Tax=Brevundimonas sp. Root1279 TaxID=1736443 RepID=UPI0006FBDCAE|nr:AraC family transcriptional regulator [Brevundimonas sp. Root1279]KQW78748.1 hypothetical protein ASC65_15640 [Brevundimonas sp. Root1279]
MTTSPTNTSRPGVASWNISAKDNPDAYEYYQSGISEWYEVSSVEDGAQRPFFTQNTVCQFGEYVLGRGRSVGQTLTRGPAEVRRSGMDAVTIILNFASTQGDVDGVDINTGPGTVHFRDLSRTSAAQVTAVDAITLVVPRDLAPRWLTERQCHGLTVDSSRVLGGLLVNHLSGLGGAAPLMTVDEGIAGIEAALMLAESALIHSDRLSANDNAAAYRSLRADAVRLIDRELFNPELGIESLMQELAVSRATLFRAFSESGGVNLFIKHRRLQKARAALLRRVGHRPTIGEIARAHGFVSESHFSRAFREYCGTAPGALGTLGALGAAPSVVSPHPQQDNNAMRYDVLLGWMKGERD